MVEVLALQFILAGGVLRECCGDNVTDLHCVELREYSLISLLVDCLSLSSEDTVSLVIYR